MATKFFRDFEKLLTLKEKGIITQEESGKIGTGILMIFTLGGYFIWALIDFIYIVSGKFTDSEGKIVKNWE